MTSAKEDDGPDVWSKEQLRESLALALNCGYAVEISGKLQGMALFQCVQDEASLLNISITSELRGCGLGSLLLTEALHSLAYRGIKRVLLEVRKSNKAARALYKKLGFGEDGLRQNYYQKPEGGREDALLMSLCLKGNAE